VDDLATVDPESYTLVCEALGRFDVTARLNEIRTPFLAIAGADDEVTPAAQHQQLAGAITNGRFAVLRGVGHLAPLEDPARTVALLREHFGRASCR
jgi:pimeloyl-ACP methyl ester carboxylesterase